MFYFYIIFKKYYMVYIMLYSENCNKYYKVKYFDKCIKIVIINMI